MADKKQHVNIREI